MVKSVWLTRVALGLLLVLAGYGCSSPPTRAAGKERKKAYEFSLRDAHGKSVRLSDYAGKVVLLNFWATYCTPCRVEIPWFVEFERKHKDQGFAVLGVAMDEEGWDVVKPYASRMGINYRLVMGDDKTAQRYGGVDALPTTFLIDREGKIAAVHVGLVSKSEYENGILQLLEDGAARRAGLTSGAGAN